jgi:DNA-directed RNA polymerase alpha subunit
MMTMRHEDPVGEAMQSIDEAERRIHGARMALTDLRADLQDLPVLRRIIVAMRDVKIEQLALMARVSIGEAVKLRNRAIAANSNVLIDECETSIRFVNILQGRGVRTLGDLARLTVKDMAGIANSGSRMVKEGRQLMARHGLCFEGDEDWLKQPETR